jgi:peptide/nickel transport system substrate-binding protein
MAKRSGPRRVAAFVAISVLSIVGSAIGSLGSAAADVRSAKGPQRGGAITYLAQGEVASLDPITYQTHIATPHTAIRGYAIYDALIAEDYRAGTLEMRVAKSLKSTDAVTWTLKLRDGVKFSDGTPYDAAAVKFNWERALNPANRAPCMVNVQGISQMTVVDPLTLQVVLKAPNGDFPSVVANTACMTFLGSPTAIQTKGTGFGTAPVGAGAWLVKEWVRDSQLTLVRNPTFYGRAAYLDQVTIRIVNDETPRMNTLVSGAADMMFTSNVGLNQQARDAGLKITNGAGSGGLNITFNMDKAPFNDVRARQAIAMAFDTRDLTAAVYKDPSQGVTSIFEKASPFYDKSLTQIKPNHKKAQELFDQLAAEGKPVQASFVYIVSLKPQAEWFQSTMAGYRNVDIRLDLVVDAALTPTLTSGAFQAAFYSFFWNNPNPGLLEAVRIGGSRNFMHYNNPQVDAAVTKAAASQDTSEQIALYRTAQRQIIKDVPFIVYSRQNNQTYYSKKVHDVDKYLWLNLPTFDRMWIRSN